MLRYDNFFCHPLGNATVGKAASVINGKRLDLFPGFVIWLSDDLL